MNNTQYFVYKRGRVVCSGNLKQCLLYLFNTEEPLRTMRELETDGIRIEPAPEANNDH